MADVTGFRPSFAALAVSMLLAVCAGAAEPPVEDTAAAAPRSEILDALNRRIELDVPKTPVPTFLGFLGDLTHVRYELSDDDVLFGPGPLMVMMRFEGTLTEALNDICGRTGLKWRVEDRAIRLAAVVPLEPKFRDLLTQKVQLNCAELPLTEALGPLEKMGVRCIVFAQDLPANGAPVTLSFEGPVREGLDAACASAGVSWRAEGSVVRIGSEGRVRASGWRGMGLPPEDVQEARATELSVDFSDTPLAEAARAVQDGVPTCCILAYGADVRDTVTFRFRGPAVRVLDLVCEQAGVRWQAEEGVIRIGSEARLRERPNRRFGAVPFAIKESLAHEVSLDVRGEQLEEAVRRVGEATGVRIVVFRWNVPAVPVTLKFTGRADQCLDYLCELADTGWEAEGGIVRVAGRAWLEDKERTRRVMSLMSAREACRSGDVARLEQLVADGWDPSTADVKILASLLRGEEQWDVMMFLIGKGLDPNSVRLSVSDAPGRRTFWSSVAVEADAELLLPADRTLLGAAVYKGDARTMRLLLDHGADPDIPDAAGCTSLLALIRKGAPRDLDVIRLMLENGADPDAADQEGRTPLNEAYKSCDEPLVRLLAEHSAAPGLSVACMLGDVDAVAAVLDKDPAFARQQGWCGHTPLYAAALYGQTEVVRLLLRRGSGLDGRSDAGRTALHAAAAGRQPAAAMLLLANGADATVADDAGITALHMAAAWADKALIEMLLEHGADAEGRDKQGRTPLQNAAAASNAVAVAVLRRHGARQ